MGSIKDVLIFSRIIDGTNQDHRVGYLDLRIGEDEIRGLVE